MDRDAVRTGLEADNRVRQRDVEQLRYGMPIREFARDRSLHLIARKRVVIGNERKRRTRARRERQADARAGERRASQAQQSAPAGRNGIRHAKPPSVSVSHLPPGHVSASSCVNHARASACVVPHICGCGCKPEQQAGRSGRPNMRQRASSSSCTQRTPAGLPFGIPGIGLEIEGAMQHAPQPGRQACSDMLGARVVRPEAFNAMARIRAAIRGSV